MYYLHTTKARIGQVLVYLTYNVENNLKIYRLKFKSTEIGNVRTKNSKKRKL